MPEDEDPLAELAALNARGRKKAVRRALKTAVTVVPAIVVWAIATPFVGWLLAAVPSVIAGVVIALVLEKTFPPEG